MKVQGLKNFIFSTEHTCTRSDPGSEIIGVPESEISAKERPDLIFIIEVSFFLN